MVGLVLVAHSRDLADALARFVEAAAAVRVPLAVAAGALGAQSVQSPQGGPADRLGTDAVAIEQAILSVSGPDGVLVLMDLGSALLAAETALELLPEQTRRGVRLCPAPLVEGAVAAAARIAAGGSLEEAFAEAAGALGPKVEHLGGPAAAAPAAPAAEPGGGVWLEAEAVVRNAHGLHLRPAARLVAAAARFRAEVQVANPQSDKAPAAASSLNGLSTLGLAQGDRIVFRARGPEAGRALEALRRLAQDGFGERPSAAGGPEAQPAEPPAAPPAAPATAAGAIQGLPVSEGFAAAPLLIAEQAAVQPSDRAPGPSAEEWAALERALGQERTALEQEQQEVSARLGADKGALFEAFRLILEDAALLEPLRQGVFGQRLNAEQAVDRAADELARRYRALADPYSRQRAADIVDLGQRVLRRLRGSRALRALRAQTEAEGSAGPVILATRELSPAAAARLDARQVLGVLSLRGGATSHSAVLVRSLGIPCITGLPESVLRAAPGTVAAMDGAAGRLWLDPDARTLERIEADRAQWLAARERAARLRREPAVSRDGRRFEVEANIASVAQAREAVEQGAEGVGVLRTEFLFLDRAEAPSEEEQLAALTAIAGHLQGRPLTVRTLDVGGDKPLAYLAQPAEANPYLGLRGARLCLLRPEVFRAQLRAVLRAAASHPVRLLLPMITTVEELERSLGALAEARASLEADRVAHGWPVPVGLMVETPSAALQIERFLERADFASIGTNDLTQYTLAAERGNPGLAGYDDALHPAVLAQIRQVAAAAAARGKEAAVCGEIAADPVAAPVLAGLGIRTLSLNPPGVPRIKETLRRLDVAAAERWAEGLLACAGAADVRREASAWLEGLGGAG